MQKASTIAPYSAQRVRLLGENKRKKSSKSETLGKNSEGPVSVVVA